MPTTTLERPETKAEEVSFVLTNTMIEEIQDSKKSTVKEKLAEIEALIESDKRLVLTHLDQEHTTAPMFSKLYAHKVTPYSLDLIALVYKYANGERTLDRFYQMTYNLRDNIAKVYKNFKELKFSERNIRNMFSGYDTDSVLNWLDNLQDTQLFSDMYGILGRIGGEQRVRIDRFLARLRLLRQVEMIYKSGVPTNFAKEFARELTKWVRTDANRNSYVAQHVYISGRELDLTQTKPHMLLGIPKSCFKLICEGVYTYRDYANIMYHLKYSVSETERKKSQQALAQTFTQIMNLHHHALELDDKYGLEKAKAVVKGETKSLILLALGNTPTNFDRQNSVAFLSTLTNTNFYRMIEYAYYQLEVEQGNSQYDFSQVETPYRTTYGDYLHMAMELGVRRDMYPKYLATQHDILSRNQRVLKDQALQEEVATQRERWVGWEETRVRGAEYLMLAPKDLGDLTTEATQMGNCVASYASSVAKGRTNILFMRKKEDTLQSVVTVEIRENKLVQAYQKFNNRISEKQADFLTKWCNKAGVALANQVPVNNGNRI